MTKQEFMAMCLPYNLKIKHFDANRESEHICKIEVWHNEEVTISDGEYEYDLLLNDILPILHPLSDLTKEIEHKGEKFVPIEKLREIIGGGWCSVYERAVELMQEWYIDTLKDKIKYLPFEFIQLFISWHFDIADLISKGEAIGVNTLEANPYK